MGQESLKKVGIGSGFIMAGFVIGAFFQYLIQIVLANSFGPETYGVFVQALAVTQAAATLSMLGIHKGVPRFIPVYRGDGDDDAVGRTLSTSLGITAFTTAFFSLTLYLLSEYIATVVFSDPAIASPLSIFSVTVVPLGLIYLFISFFRGFENAKLKVFLDDIVFSGLVLLFASAVVFFSGSINQVIYGYLVAEMITVIAGYFLLKGKFPLKPRLGDLSKDTAEKLMSFSWPLFLVSIFLMINKWAGVWTLGALSESAQVGVYNASYSLAGVLFLTLNALNYMFLPTASSLYGKGDEEGIRELFSNVTRWIVTASIPIFIGMLIFPSEILRLFFTSSYARQPAILSIMAGGFFYAVLTGPSGSLLVAADRTREKMIGIATVSVTLILLSLLLIPEMGVLGAAIATSGGLVLGHSVLLALAIRKIGSLPYSQDFIRIVPATLIPLAVIYIVKDAIKPGITVSIGLGIAYVLMYLFLIEKFDVVRDEEKTIIREALKSVRNRLGY